MTKFLILHGTGASPSSHWFTWLKQKLENDGHEVWLPQLPDSDKPNTSKYISFLLNNPDFRIDDKTIIVGHSSGAVAGLILLQHLADNVTIKAAFLVSAFINDLGWDALSELFIEDYDFETIKRHCSVFKFIHSDTDPYCPLDDAQYLATKLSGELLMLHGQGHFNTEASPDYVKFPLLYDYINNLQTRDALSEQEIDSTQRALKKFGLNINPQATEISYEVMYRSYESLAVLIRTSNGLYALIADVVLSDSETLLEHMGYKVVDKLKLAEPDPRTNGLTDQADFRELLCEVYSVTLTTNT